MTTGCANCHGEGWVCENHPSQGWPSACSCGAGEPCPTCNPLSLPYARLLSFVRSLVRENDTEEWLEQDSWGPDYGEKPDEAYRGGKSDALNVISQRARDMLAALEGE